MERKPQDAGCCTPKVDWSTRNDADKNTYAIEYPNNRFADTRAARPDDDNVEESKIWVDENEK